MVNLEKLVRRIGSDVDAPGANDSEEKRGVEVLTRKSARCRPRSPVVRPIDQSSSGSLRCWAGGRQLDHLF
jgi:hypothetical protein